MSNKRLKGEGSIRKRPDGRWEVRVSAGLDFATGHTKRVSKYADTQEEAVRMLHELQVLHAQGYDITGKTKLGEWLLLWLEVYMKDAIKQATYASYETIVKRHFIPAMGEIPLAELSPRLLQQFYRYKRETEGLSSKTIVNMNLCLHKALEHALREKLITSNPASAINLPRGERPDVTILTLDEQRCLMQASYAHRYGVFVRLVLATGLRLGELLGLRWEDIDVQASMLYVRRTLNRLPKTNLPQDYTGSRTEIVIQEPKSKNSKRSIPLLPMVLQELLQWRSVQECDRAAAGERYTDSGMIVTNPYGGYVEPRTFKDYYDSILRLAGIGHRTFHALRHTFASRAMELGMDAKTLSMLMGHASVSFTMDTYAHVLDEQKISAMQLMTDVYAMGAEKPESRYSIVVTPGEDGVSFYSPDFPGVVCDSETFDEGLQNMRDMMGELVLADSIPPAPIDPRLIAIQPGQMLVQVSV